MEHRRHVAAESGDVGFQVDRQTRRVGQEPDEVVAGDGVERKSRGPAKLAMRIRQLALQVGVALQNLLLCGCHHAFEAAQHRKGQDHIGVLATLEGVADEVGDAPDEADALAVVDGTWGVRETRPQNRWGRKCIYSEVDYMRFLDDCQPRVFRRPGSTRPIRAHSQSSSADPRHRCLRSQWGGVRYAAGSGVPRLHGPDQGTGPAGNTAGGGALRHDV